MDQANEAAGGHVLRSPKGTAEWSAYHAIRRRAIFETYLPEVAYDPDHPDETGPGRRSLVLVTEGEVVGTVRVDLLDDERAALRLVAIDPDRQREGHGSVLLRLVEDFIRSERRSRVILHGNPETIGFYLTKGYAEAPWADDVSMAGEHVDLAKEL